MHDRLVIAYHLIWTGYGHWLPNDPRGSGSKQVRSDVLAELGEIHYGRKSLQPSRQEVIDYYAEADERLKSQRLKFTPQQIEAIGQSFATTITEQRYTCYACAILPDHVHLVIRKHKHVADEMIELLQELSRQSLLADPSIAPDHPIWTSRGWHVFLFEPGEVRARIRYVENNPVKEGLPKQAWPFVKEYDDWPLHPGHNPNSPWARGIREYHRRLGR